MERAVTTQNREWIAEFTQGFFEATQVGEFNFTNLLLCIYEADQAALILYEGVEILEEAWADKNWQEAIGGVIAGVAFVQQLEASLPVCEAIDASSANWTNFHHIIEVIETPEKLQVIEKDMFLNGRKISQEIMWFAKSLETGHYKKAGKIFGNVLMEATTESQDNLFIF